MKAKVMWLDNAKSSEWHMDLDFYNRGPKHTPVLVIDLSPESVAALCKKAADAFYNDPRPNPGLGQSMQLALAAIGIKARRPAKQKTKKKGQP